MLLSAYAFLIYLPLTVIPALLQALNRDRSVDHAFSVVTLVLLSLPDFLLATILLLTFVVMIPLLPAISLVDQTSCAWEYFRAMTLPALTLAIVMAVYAVRMLRDNLIEVLDSDYIRMAELKGLSRRRVLLHHALPNALVPWFITGVHHGGSSRGFITGVQDEGSGQGQRGHHGLLARPRALATNRRP